MALRFRSATRRPSSVLGTRRDPALDRLRSLELFAHCPDDELVDASRRLTLLHTRPGAVLTRFGMAGRQFGVVLDGSAVVTLGPTIVATLGPGEWFGEIAVLDHGNRTATVTCETELTAFVCSAEFHELLVVSPTFARTLLVGVARRFRTLESAYGALLRPTTAS